MSPVFAAYRDRLTTEIDAIEARRDDFESAFDALEPPAASTRDDLQLAWTFTTASTENTTAGILKMRDETMVALGDSTPEFQITSVNEDAGGRRPRPVRRRHLQRPQLHDRRRIAGQLA